MPGKTCSYSRTDCRTAICIWYGPEAGEPHLQYLPDAHGLKEFVGMQVLQQRHAQLESDLARRSSLGSMPGGRAGLSEAQFCQ